MKKSQAGNYFIAGLVAFHLLLWLFFHPPAEGTAFITLTIPPPHQTFENPGMETVGEILSSTAILLMACAAWIRCMSLTRQLP